jgi:putative flavoprotein involved in K+ transport
MAAEFETIIVGAGQTGLSLGRYLKDKNRSFAIFEKSDHIGSAWKSRYDSLVLDSFAKYGSLEDFPFPGDPLRRPERDEVVTYLENFAKHFSISPQFSTEVTRIEKEGEGFIVSTNKGDYRSRFVVLATGAFEKPHIPERAKNISRGILEMHSSEYRNPESLGNGDTLVVGGGNSGAEIVEEILATGRKVFFSTSRKFKSIKSSRLSQWLAYELGLAHVPKRSVLGKIVIWYTEGKAVGVDTKSLLKNPGLTLVGRFIDAAGDKIICEKKNLENIKNVVWATGYQSDFSIFAIPGFDPGGERRGVTNIPGLFILNLRWQYSKSSSHLAGVSRDAKYIANYIIDKSKE